MTVRAESLQRAFDYNGAQLADPAPDMPVDMVKEFYATTYPELATAVVEGPEAVGGRLLYRFKRAVGTKG